MTNYNKATLITFFQQGDVPSGTDYANFINSCVNLVETTEQDMAGALGTTELIASRVSAGNINCTGTFSTGTFTTGAFTATTLTVGSVSASGQVVAGSFSTLGDVFSLGRITGSAATINNGIIQGVGIVSAAGTTQAAATVLVNTINRGQGISDGSTTGFAIPANKSGLTQYLLVETNTSANLWPPTGGTINAKSANTPFALAGQTSYTIFHVGASAYGVK